jgi:hypothetical protein
LTRLKRGDEQALVDCCSKNTNLEVGTAHSCRPCASDQGHVVGHPYSPEHRLLPLHLGNPSD